jgi:flagellar biosynthesis component FlhA
MTIVEVLEWQGTTKTKVRTLQELLEVLLGVSQQGEDIDLIVEQNRKNIEAWIRTNFPKKLGIIVHFEEKYTAQQWFEQLVRDLRQIVE